MAAARRRRLSPTLATFLLALLVLLPGVAASAQPATATPEPGGSRLTITSITPVVDGEDTATVRGRLTNTGPRALSEPRVAVVPQQAGPKRADIAEWTKGEDPVTGTALDSTTLDDIPAGRSAPFVLNVEGEELLQGLAAGAAWVSVQTDDRAVHTFIGVHRTKEYEPLRLLWGIPLLLPGNRNLYGTSGQERTDAWRDAVGPDSRLAGLTEESPDSNEAWLLDPSLLTVPPDDDTRESTQVSSEERTLRTERAATLRSRLVATRTLVLPDGDADVAAGAESDSAARLVTPRVEQGTRVAKQLGARSDVMWPADGLASAERATGLRELRPTGKKPTLLVPDSSLSPAGFSPTGGTRTTDDTPLVISDGPLSRLVSDLGSAADLTLARQQFVAETAALMRERAGTARTVVIVPERGSTPSVEAWQQLRDSADDIPWLAKGDLPSVLDDADEAEPAAAARGPEQITAATKGDAAPAPVLTEGRSRKILQDQRSMVTFASVRTDGTAWRRAVQPSVHQLTSARWRDHRYAFIRLHHALGDAMTLARDDLEVSSGDVNFFADTGRLQITIENHTEVELTNLTVRLTPGNHSLRVDDTPDPVTIGPGGRQTVTVQASALAAGQVPVEVAVTTPGGHEVAAPATLHVKVRPTGDSIYWVIGGAAVLLLAAGTWRTVRGGRRPSKTPTEPTEESA